MQSQDGIPQPARSLAAATLALTVFVAVVDHTIANIALPLITADLDVRAVDAIWVVNSYQLVVTMALLPLASMGDIFGYRRVYLGGLALFTAASLLCVLAGSLPMLIVARALQGLGAAGIMSINIALVRFIFPRAMLGRAIGNVAVVVAISSAAGPTIAAGILSVAPWQGLFLINVPIGLVALVIGYRTLPKTPTSGHRFDIRSAVLSAATFGLLILGINNLGHSEALPVALLQIGAGAAIGAAFAWYQLKLPAPMLPVDLLRKPVFALSVLTSSLSFGGQAITFVCLPFFLHDTMGRSAWEIGLLLTPWPIATAVAAMVSGRLADRFEPGRVAAIGLSIFVLGLLLIAMMPAMPTDLDLCWRLVVAGFGFGIFQAPNNKAMISSAPRNRSGGASGLQSTARLVGQSVGVALLAAVFGLVQNDAIRVALWVAVALSGSGLIPAFLRRSSPDAG